MEWEKVLAQLAGDTRSRLQGLGSLQVFLQHNELDRTHTGQLVDAAVLLLKDNNFKVCQSTLQTLKQFIDTEGDAIRPYANAVVKAVVEKLGDMKQQVRDEAIALLLSLMTVLGTENMFERLKSAWAHKSWHVRASLITISHRALASFGVAAWPAKDRAELVIKPLGRLLEDSSSCVREAALECLGEASCLCGPSVVQTLSQCSIRPGQLRELEDRLQRAATPEIPGIPSFPVAIEPSDQDSQESVHSFEADTPRSAGGSPQEMAAAQLAALGVRDPGPSHLVAPPAESSSSSRSQPASVSGRPSLAVAPRRGGYKDTGIPTVPGALTDAAPIPVSSERELRDELDKVVKQLDPKVDWTKRIDALVRLEGLLRGGAANFPGLMDMMKVVREPLTVQLNDRRSAVSKQACHLLAMMAQLLGGRFEPFASVFFPMIFKVVVITVQVMAEAADMCARAILRHCHTPRILPPLCNAICTDRAAKLRNGCVEYLLLVLQQWEPTSYEKHLDLVEAALRSACLDALAEVRVVGRNAFAAYARAWPDRAAANVLRRMDPGAQEKLAEAVSIYRPGASEPMVADAQPVVQRPASRRATVAFLAPPLVSVGLSNSALASSASAAAASAAMPPPVARPPSRPRLSLAPRPPPPMLADEAPPSSSTTVAFPPSNGSANAFPLPSTAAGNALPPPPDPAPPLPSRKNMRRSIGGSALRVALQQALPGSEFLGLRDPQGPPAGSRYSEPSYMDMGTRAQSSGAMRVSASLETLREEPDVSGYGHAESVAGGDDETCSIAGMREEHLRTVNMTQILAMAGATEAGWKGKVEAFLAFQGLMQLDPTGATQDFTQQADRLINLFVEHLSDPHFKVAQAAIDALAEVLRVCPRVAEPHLDRLLPQLFLRAVDAKEALRRAARSCLDVLPQQFSIEGLLSPLCRALESVKMAKARLAVLEFFLARMRPEQPLTDAAAVGSLRAWVARVAALLNDKNGELRRLAGSCLEAVYRHMDAPTLLMHVAAAPPPVHIALRRALGPLIPGLDAEIAPYMRPALHRTLMRGGLQVSASTESLRQSIDMEASSAADSAAAPLPAPPQHLGTSYALPAGIVSADAALVRHAELSAAQRPTLAAEPAVPDFSRGFQGLHPGAAAFVGDPGRAPAGTAGIALQSHPVLLAEVASPPEEPFRVGIPAGQDQLPGPSQGEPFGGFRTFSGQGGGYGDENEQPGGFGGTLDDSVRLASPALEGGLEPAGGPEQLERHLGSGILGLKTRIDLEDEEMLARLSLDEDAQVITASASPQHLPDLRPSPASVAPGPASALMSGPERELVGVLARLGNSEADSLEALHRLSGLAASLPLDTWHDHLPQVVALVMAELSSGDPDTREAALLLLRDVAARHSGTSAGVLERHLPDLVPRVLEACGDHSRVVCMAADEAVEALLAQVSPARYLALLHSLLPASPEAPVVEGRVIQAAVRNLAKCASRVAAGELLALLPELLPPLFVAFKHPSADVRKAVVFCLVDLWMVVGDELGPHLSGLTSSQLKLVTIYVTRAQSRQQSQVAKMLQGMAQPGGPSALPQGGASSGSQMAVSGAGPLQTTTNLPHHRNRPEKSTIAPSV